MSSRSKSFNRKRKKPTNIELSDDSDAENMPPPMIQHSSKRRKLNNGKYVSQNQNNVLSNNINIGNRRNHRNRNNNNNNSDSANDSDIQIHDYPSDRNKWDRVQSNIERQRLRMQYQKLNNELEKISKGKTVTEKCASFVHHLSRQQTLYAQITRPTEAQIDMKHTLRDSMSLSSIVSEFCDVEFSVNVPYLMQEYEENYKLNEIDNDNENDKIDLDWYQIGLNVSQYYYSVPKIQFMSGVIDYSNLLSNKQRKKPKRKRINRNRVDPIEKLVQPKEADLYENNDDNEYKNDNEIKNDKNLQKRLKNIKKSIKKSKNKKQNMFELLVDPDKDNGYSQTIENFKDFGYLVKTGDALVITQNDQPVVNITNSEFKDKFKNRESGQCVVKLDYNIWNNLVNSYNITESQLHRSSRALFNENNTHKNQNNIDSDDNDSNSGDNLLLDEESDNNIQPSKPKKKPNSQRTKKGRKKNDKREIDEDSSDEEDD